MSLLNLLAMKHIYVCNLLINKLSKCCVLFLAGIKTCMKNTKYVSEEPYEITMDVHGIREGPYLGRQRALNKVSFVSL